MIEAGILEGDTVVIERSSTANHGDIVVALIQKQEATLKTLLKERAGPHWSAGGKPEL